jgi:hypothetical protein
MLKDIQNGFSKFFTRDKVIIFIILIILGYFLITYSNSKSAVLDPMDGGNNIASSQQTTTGNTSAGSASMQSTASMQPVTSGYALQPVANPKDLLPKDQNSQWATLNPNSVSQGNILMPDLLQAGYHIGLDTIGQTLRNANQQLRSDPVIPKKDVGPWQQSTIEPDYGRVPLEIGYGCR